MRKLLQRSLLQAILLLATFHVALAQNVINGRVTDATTGDPLIGASVIVKTDRQGVVTDVNGNFTLKVVDPQDKLRISYIGLRTVMLDIDRKAYNVMMKPSTILKTVPVTPKKRAD